VDTVSIRKQRHRDASRNANIDRKQLTMSEHVSTPMTVVLVHGAWNGGWAFDKVVSALTSRGIAVVAPDLPGHGSDQRPVGDLSVDTAGLVEVLSNIDGQIVLLGHSYGGLVISEAVANDEVRAKLAHLVYLCAICNVGGARFRDLPAEVHEGGLLGPLVRLDDEGLAYIDVSDIDAVKTAFYGDCTDEDVRWAAAKLCPQPRSNTGGVAQVSAPNLVPSTYIVCTQDRAIPVAAQRAMISAQIDGGATMEVIEWAASHSPYLSMPDALTDVLEALARG
jgi:pimeloyl-ACP methyl ester carboxylesterase